MAPTVPIDFVGQKESKKGWFLQPMGKSRKYSKGHSSGFVPDYRHAVETMGESEGFGSSGRIDTEMTMSEDSFAPKMKCISLNNDVYDCFGVPMQVLSLSKMSPFERKDLELRLKRELEQIRILQQKAASLSTSAVVMSPSSDIRSCSDGQKRPVLENVHRSISAPQSKKRAGPGRNGARTKKSMSGRYESVKQAAPMSTSSAALMKQCENVLDRLMSHSYGWVFNTPVDVVKLNIPDYFNVIKHPMDLGTVKRKIASSEYLSPLEFAADVRLTFANAMKYNPPGNNVHIMAQTLGKLFESRWKAVEKKLSITNDVESAPLRGEVHTETESVISGPPPKKKKTTPFDEVKMEKVKQVMSVKEKQNLSMELESLLAELPECIIDFLKEHSYNADQTSEDEIEIDIDALSDETLFKLRKLLDDYLIEKQNKQAAAEPCEMEVINESNLSNSSFQPFRDIEPVDEDIDVVGGNEPPISSYPPLHIEKDAVHRNSKVSGSISSSGESSSSSDSDSSSLSGSETKAAKASLPLDSTKEDERSGDNMSEKRSGLDESAIGNQSANELASSEGKSTAVEVDVNQEGECAPPDRQVSPDKLYRAALLRSRFADTILKAREKALEKGEKKDPEKLRMEKEELERRQKEEKARLQAEARAAEEARRRAEVEAAAEAKRKREMEREAARQALLQMEKTVDINENSRLMEDLEMLRTVQDEQVVGFLEETSPEHSQNGLGSFKLKGNNPLEQLGLFMKEDDEEEEEVLPAKSVSEPVKDVEEGEID